MTESERALLLLVAAILRGRILVGNLADPIAAEIDVKQLDMWVKRVQREERGE